ncbi:hypothetical protein BDZ97DRAFT_1764821 [Flammula alnicola]|nr:hypothetical protein BDZ97DRAFT_1764821 [Flammula alnicola]
MERLHSTGCLYAGKVKEGHFRYSRNASPGFVNNGTSILGVSYLFELVQDVLNWVIDQIVGVPSGSNVVYSPAFKSLADQVACCSKVAWEANQKARACFTFILKPITARSRCHPGLRLIGHNENSLKVFDLHSHSSLRQMVSIRDALDLLMTPNCECFTLRRPLEHLWY